MSNDFTIFVAVFAMLATLWQGILIRRQVRHGENLSRSRLYQQIAHQFIRLDEFFVKNPDLRPYFYAAAELPPDELNRQRALATAELVADLAESCVAVNDVLGARQSGDWDQYFRHLYETSPALREFWSEHGYLYPQGVWDCLGAGQRQPHQTKDLDGTSEPSPR
jgi:hypothetical protein